MSFSFVWAKLQKNLVKAKRFWKINAIRPEIKARRGKTRKFNLGQKANWGGLAKELGCQIVTLKAPLTARWYPPRDTQSRGPSLIPQTATFCIAMDYPKDSSFAAQN